MKKIAIISCVLAVVFSCGESQKEREALTEKYQYVADMMARIPIIGNEIVPGRDGIKEFKKLHSMDKCRVSTSKIVDEVWEVSCRHWKNYSNTISVVIDYEARTLSGKSGKLAFLNKNIQYEYNGTGDAQLVEEAFQINLDTYVEEFGQPTNIEYEWRNYQWIIQNEPLLAFTIRVLPRQSYSINYSVILGLSPEK